jgi:hypothetical protein
MGVGKGVDVAAGCADTPAAQAGSSASNIRPRKAIHLYKVFCFTSGSLLTIMVFCLEISNEKPQWITLWPEGLYRFAQLDRLEDLHPLK